MKKLICFLFVFTAFISLKSGNDPSELLARADLKKVINTYEKTPDFSTDLVYKVYTEHQGEELLESKNGKFIRYKDKSYTKIDDIETYAINNRLISISGEDKVISIGDNQKLELHPLQTNIDSLLTLCDKIEVETINGVEKKYKLFFEESETSEFNRVDIHIDTKSYRYLKIVLFYQAPINLKNDFYAEEKQPRLEIQYKNFKQLVTEPALFNESLYVTADGEGKLKPAPKYYNYKIKDLRNQTRIKTSK